MSSPMTNRIAFRIVGSLRSAWVPVCAGLQPGEGLRLGQYVIGLDTFERLWICRGAAWCVQVEPSGSATAIELVAEAEAKAPSTPEDGDAAPPPERATADSPRVRRVKE